MTTDEFIQAALDAGESEDDAWSRYSQQVGHRDRAEFASGWLFWRSAIGRAIRTNPSVLEDESAVTS